MTLRVKQARALSEEELRTAALLRDYARNQLRDVRSVAEKWRTGIGLASIVGGAVALFAAHDVLTALPAQARADGAVLAGAATLFAILSIALSLRASIGWPKSHDLRNGANLRKWEADELATARRCLRWSMILAIPSILAAAFAVLVLLFQLPLPGDIHLIRV